jgi:hypothetical protein
MKLTNIVVENVISSEILKRINPTDRIHMSHDERLTIQKKDLKQGSHWKPKGFWYAFGTEWVDWVRTEMPEWEKPHLFKIDIDASRILQLNSTSDIQEFTKKYGNDEEKWTNYSDWSLSIYIVFRVLILRICSFRNSKEKFFMC